MQAQSELAGTQGQIVEVMKMECACRMGEDLEEGMMDTAVFALAKRTCFQVAIVSMYFSTSIYQRIRCN